jgi:Zn-finger protein
MFKHRKIDLRDRIYNTAIIIRLSDGAVMHACVGCLMSHDPPLSNELSNELEEALQGQTFACSDCFAASHGARA